MDDAWEGTVIKKSRGLLDGSNMYRRLTVRLTDGMTAKLRVNRVNRALWDSVSAGSTLVKAVGQDPGQEVAL